jgi:hypothetical protein
MREREAGELFCLLDRVALARYEGAHDKAFMCLCRAGEERITPRVVLETAMPMTDVRGVRKMLHVSAPGLPALCDGRTIHGFGHGSGPAEGLLSVRFEFPGKWQLRRGATLVAESKVNSTCEPRFALPEESLRTAMRHTFGPLPEGTLAHLWGLILPATRQPRGTNVLISDHAALEAVRLEPQCTTVKPFPLTADIMERITGIDGTLIMDLDGNCHAIGAILDGGVSARGDRNRGGRYNSALMYVDGSLSRSLIVVVSEDGTVDLVAREPAQADR